MRLSLERPTFVHHTSWWATVRCSLKGCTLNNTLSPAHYAHTFPLCFHASAQAHRYTLAQTIIQIVHKHTQKHFFSLLIFITEWRMCSLVFIYHLPCPRYWHTKSMWKTCATQMALWSFYCTAENYRWQSLEAQKSEAASWTVRDMRLTDSNSLLSVRLFAIRFALQMLIRYAWAVASRKHYKGLRNNSTSETGTQAHEEKALGTDKRCT